MKSSNANPLVVGSGALGRLLAARLSLADWPVLMWSARLDALIGRVTSVANDTEGVLRLHLRSDSSSEASVPSLAYITVKTFQLERTLKSLAKSISRGTPIVLTQNGVCSAPIAARLFDRVIVATPFLIAEAVEPFGVAQTLNGYIAIADYPQTRGLADIKQLAEQLRRAGFHVPVATHWEDILYPKLVLASTSALFALRNVSIQQALTVDSIRCEMQALATEGLKVVEAALTLYGLHRHKALEATHRLVCALQRGKLPFAHRIAGASRDARTSLQQDMERKRGQTEVMEVNGELVRLGTLVGVRTPLNSALTTLVETATKRLQTPRDLAEQYKNRDLNELGRVVHEQPI